jgi:dynein light chain LC8-type
MADTTATSNLGTGQEAPSGQPNTRTVIKSVDMTDQMQTTTVDIAVEALQKNAVEKDIAAHIKREMDRKQSPTWHVVVGKNFGSFVTHGKCGRTGCSCVQMLFYVVPLMYLYSQHTTSLTICPHRNGALHLFLHRQNGIPYLEVLDTSDVSRLLESSLNGLSLPSSDSTLAVDVRVCRDNHTFIFPGPTTLSDRYLRFPSYFLLALAQRFLRPLQCTLFNLSHVLYSASTGRVHWPPLALCWTYLRPIYVHRRNPFGSDRLST